MCLIPRSNFSMEIGFYGGWWSTEPIKRNYIVNLNTNGILVTLIQKKKPKRNSLIHNNLISIPHLANLSPRLIEKMIIIRQKMRNGKLLVKEAYR